MALSRHGLTIVPSLAAFALAAPLAAQEPVEAQTGEPPERIDLLIDTTPQGQRLEDCSRDQDAATITGEIVVCRRSTGDENRLYDDETAKNRHAEKSAFRADPRTPDFITDCHDLGWPAGCFRVGKVPPPAYLIDFDELPEAPPGSDADRIARGLAPRADNRLGSNEPIIISEEQLGLPPPLEPDVEASPSGSASPAAEPSG